MLDEKSVEDHSLKRQCIFVTCCLLTLLSAFLYGCRQQRRVDNAKSRHVKIKMTARIAAFFGSIVYNSCGANKTLIN